LWHCFLTDVRENVDEAQKLFSQFLKNNMREVGQIMELTESRISQIHAGGLKRLREELIAPVGTQGAGTSEASVEALFRLLMEN
jgi:hypothetical protein